MLTPVQLAQQAIFNAKKANKIAESKPDSSIISGVSLGHDAKGYLFRTGNGGTVYATILSTTEPVKGESYLLIRTPGSDVVTAKPKPRL